MVEMFQFHPIFVVYGGLVGVANLFYIAYF